jgi:hypothetical protein
MNEIKLKKIPKKIFIVPYRNRGPQFHFFCKWINEFILKDNNDYEIYFSHQYDNRVFNRGAVKNIGFIIAKKLYPNDYKNITFIFNDIDCLPYKNIFSYETDIGKVAHYYGFKHSLGGIVVIKGIDFENINGFINLYSWGQEDRSLQTRCIKNNITIDRSNFYQIGSKEILQLFDGVNRIINNNELKKIIYDDNTDGLNTIFNLLYSVDKVSKNKEDELFIQNLPENVFIINIYKFLTKYRYNINDFSSYDLRKSETELYNDIHKLNKNLFCNFDSDNWSNIPLFDNIKSNITSSNTKPSHNYSNTKPNYNNNTNNNNNNTNNNTNNNSNNNTNNNYLKTQNVKPNVNYNNVSATQLYSKNYALKNNIQSKATTSIKVGLGGLIQVNEK